IVMVKPAMPYLDVISKARALTNLPIAAYNVSGEYSMVKAAAANGWIDERRVVLELLTGIVRAGADLIITYHAKDVARWLREGAEQNHRSPRNPIGTQSTATRQQSMKTSTAYQISFANAFADLYLDKENGEVALDLRRQEVTIYLNQTQYQALVLLIQQSLE